MNNAAASSNGSAAGVSRNPSPTEAGYVRLYRVRPYFAVGLSDWPFARNSLEYLIAADVRMPNAMRFFICDLRFRLTFPACV